MFSTKINLISDLTYYSGLSAMKPRKSAVKRSPKKQAPLQVVEEELEEEEEVCYFRFFLRGLKSPSPCDVFTL